MGRERTKKDIASKQLEVERLRAINSSSVLMTPTGHSTHAVGESADHEAGSVVDTSNPPLPDETHEIALPGHVTSADGDFEDTGALPQQHEQGYASLMTPKSPDSVVTIGQEAAEDVVFEERMMTRALSQELPVQSAEEDGSDDDAVDAEMYGGGGGGTGRGYVSL